MPKTLVFSTLFIFRVQFRGKILILSRYNPMIIPVA
uniref:Uncharacterized protein n=2 Tax=unclassified Caudoviricetes TaxID=2788787 RepID=A0A8S5ULK1_9CAUD|nr:MAG TPA: hypothetical protein [Siphoviridae sp. ctEQg15]DAF95254.1 MAG TPA: hypothetical protein [Siphoviridae sp. ctOH142]